MKRLLVLIMCIVLCGSILTGCRDKEIPVETISGKADVEEYVSVVKLEIRSGILYVTVYDGTIYKTTIEADEIEVQRPEFGKGTVSTAEIIKDNKTVKIFARSDVQEFDMTKEEVEEEFGPVTVVVSSDDRE